MTWSLTLAGLPRAGANTMPHDDEQKYKKMNNLSTKRVLTGKQFEEFRRKKIRKTFSLDQTTPWNTWLLKTTIEYGLRKQ